MRFVRPGFFSGWIYPEALFRIKTREKVLCLTFDDGPDSASTPFLLELLERHHVRAMFFCNGKAAEKHHEIIDEIISGGHIIGNHGYEHLDGWTTSLKCYLKNAALAAPFTSERFFRPPYGRLRLSQYQNLKTTYKIIFWDIMPFDFDKSFGGKNSLKILKKKIRPGSVIVLHDSPDSSAISILDEFIEFSLDAGYRFILPSVSDS